MRPHPSAFSLDRRRWLALVPAAALTAAGCTSLQNPFARRLTAEQKTSLGALGFAPENNAYELDLAARVPFALDASTLTIEVEATLMRIARTLLSVGIDGLTVDGHSDNQGSDEYNQRLSERRADAVAEALIARGMSRERIIRRAFGATRPVAPNTTEAGRRQNRRAVLLVPFA
jgi:outer membrane protein OmpA-like peptidoglycan-associated protein